MERIDLILKVNGREQALAIPPDLTLLEVLRDKLGLFGAREGCGIGMCGACTVLVDRQAMSSCLLLAAQVEGREILTIEGLSQEGELHPAQKAYLERSAFQCAYCTPGFILSTMALVEDYTNPDDAQIRSYLSGNLCRCGSYVNILEAAKAYARSKAEVQTISPP